MKAILLFLLSLLMFNSQNSTAEQTNSAKIASMVGKFSNKFKVTQIKANDLLKLIESKELILVDVRDQDESDVSIIKGAISKNEFESNRRNLKGRKVVIYCTIGYRSSVYVEELAKQNVEAANLEGGILSWLDVGGKVVDKKNTFTKNVHVYGKDWDILPKGYNSSYK
jgi:rhodanese-related sulfurtransferase